MIDDYPTLLSGGVSMRKLGTFLVLLFVLSLTFAAVSFPREETVYIAGALWGPATTWNLYAPQST